MAAGFFTLVGMFMLLVVPVVAVYWSMTIGMAAAFSIASGSIGMSMLIFALAFIIDRLDQVVVAVKASKIEA